MGPVFCGLCWMASFGGLGWYHKAETWKLGSGDLQQDEDMVRGCTAMPSVFLLSNANICLCTSKIVWSRCKDTAARAMTQLQHFLEL